MLMLTCGILNAAEFEVIDEFSVGGSSFVVKNGNVGIGTAVPTSRLQVISSTAAAYIVTLGTGTNYSLVVSTSGNVGIGTTVPSAKLDVNGNLAIQGSIDCVALDDRLLLLTLRTQMAGASGGPMKYQNTVSDAFGDQTGIDAAASLNDEYDSNSLFYSPSLVSYSSDQCNGGIPISGGDYASNYDRSYAFDNTYSNRWYSQQLQNISGVAYIGYDFASGNSKAIKKFTIKNYSPQNTPASIKLQYSDDGSLWNDVQTFSVVADNQLYTYIVTAAVAVHRYWRLIANANLGGGEGWCLEEIEMMIGTGYNNMTLISNAAEADFYPTQTRMIVIGGSDDTISINTDLKGWVSEDNGVNYDQVTLAYQGDFDGTRKIYAGTVALTNRNDKTMRQKITTYGKTIRIYGWALEWK